MTTTTTVAVVMVTTVIVSVSGDDWLEKEMTYTWGGRLWGGRLWGGRFWVEDGGVRGIEGGGGR